MLAATVSTAASADDDEDADAGVSRPFLYARLRLLFTFLLLGYGIMCLLSCALVAYLRVHRRHAFAGDQRAARRVILPAFEPLLLVLAAATVVYSLYFATALATDLFAFDVSRVSTEIFYSGRQFVFLSVIVFMLQPSVSLSALKRSMAATFVLATYTVPIVALLTKSTATKTQFYVAHTTARAPLLLLYAYVIIKPPARASKQSLREFCVYAFVYYALLFAYNARFFHGDAHNGFLLTYVNLIWGSLCPLVIWRVLQADTEYWRRLGQRAVALQQNLSSSLSSTASTSFGSASASTSSAVRRGNVLALECTAANGAHVLVEMHRKFVIDFAYLELKHPIACGRGGRHHRQHDDTDGPVNAHVDEHAAHRATRAPVVVYRGVLRGAVHVAVKVYTPRRLDEATIAEFAQEAALCGALRHPNVVHFVGLCVRPPTICMVAELCVGNLEEMTRARHRKHAPSTVADMPLASLPPPRQQHQQLLISLAHMLDAARAVAYLHSFTPPFLHRDITPASFLVDANGTVKLTDFGDSRSLPAAQQADAFDPSASGAKPSSGRDHQISSTLPLDLADLATPSPSTYSMPSAHCQASAWHRQASTPSTQTQTETRLQHVMTIKGTVEYMAPELLLGHAGHACYGEAADVYALAVTMWDILYPTQLKYPLARNNRLKVFEAVLAGERPRLDDELPAPLQELLITAWHEDARLRPRADDVVSILESLQEELAAAFAEQLVGELSTRKLLVPQQQQQHAGQSPRELVAGSALVDLLVSIGHVDDDGEALRLGNALLDASMVHHATHTRPFEASDDETYYFDTVKIRACRWDGDWRARSEQKRDRAALARTHRSKATSSALWTPTVAPQDNARPGQNHAPPRSKNALARPPSAPLLSRRGRRGRSGPCYVSLDPVDVLCACRKISQRLQEPSATRHHTHDGAPRHPPTRPTLMNKTQTLRKVKSSPVFEHKLLVSNADDELPETDRMTDWECFALAIEDSDDETDEPMVWESNRINNHGLLRKEDLT